MKRKLNGKKNYKKNEVMEMNEMQTKWKQNENKNKLNKIKK